MCVASMESYDKSGAMVVSAVFVIIIIYLFNVDKKVFT